MSANRETQGDVRTPTVSGRSPQGSEEKAVGKKNGRWRKEGVAKRPKNHKTPKRDEHAGLGLK